MLPAELRETEGAAPVTNQQAPKEARGFTFWAIIVALCITSLLAALENTVVSTSLPFIVDRLKIGKNYVWITNGFFLARYTTLSVNFSDENRLTIFPVLLYNHYSVKLPTVSADGGWRSSSSLHLHSEA